jgi:hypothetical protein
MSELKEAVPKLVQRKIMAPNALSDFDDDLFRQEANTMLRAMSDAANETAPYFITSFCIHDAGSHLSGGQPLVGQDRAGACLVSQHPDHGVQRRVHRIDASQVRIYHLRRAQLSTRNALRQFSG